MLHYFCIKLKRRLKTRSLIFPTLTAAILMLLAASCSTVKFVPEDKYLLNKTDVKIDNKQISREEVNTYIRQKENLKILSFLRFHLWLYNLSSKEKTNDWLKRIGEEPVIYNEVLKQASENQIVQYLRNKGYYNAVVDGQLEFNEKRRKVNLKYVITSGKPYVLRNINYQITDSALRAIFLKENSGSYLKPGQLFDVDILEKERERVAALFKNHGYYYFGKDLIYYKADSSQNSNQADVELRITQPDRPEIERSFHSYQVRNVTINLGTDSRNPAAGIITGGNGISPAEGYLLNSQPGINYHPNLLLGLNQVKSNSLYCEKRAKETFDAYNRLNQFRFINILFDEPDSLPGRRLLDCSINLVPMTKQSASFDVEGTNTSGNFGIAGNLSFQHRNTFRNAEILRVNLRGAMERQQAVISNVSGEFNTRELGVETRLTIPRLTGPAKWLGYFDKFLPQTVFTLGYNYQERPDYTRTIANLKMGYDWKSSEYYRHFVNLIDFNWVDLYQFDADFINSIKDLYIKSSFTDHLILSSNYSLTYNTQDFKSRSSYRYFKFSFESAGNLLNLASKLVGANKTEVTDSLGSSDYYKLFDIRYAQYVKSDFEFRYGFVVDKYNTIAGRAFLGVGVPYGNFDVLPFEKKYFTGGANGIRAWQVRSLGPGTYNPGVNDYPNQSSDIKLEANIEYRFRLLKMFEGALFFDAGNIWAVNRKDNREGAVFEFGKFYKQIAFGTGAGFRFDFDYFIFRLDLGMKLRDPSQELADGWILGSRKLTSNDFNLSFAIGYPF